MRMRTVLMTALAFVGLVVGAGFATGQEVLQYFISFGAIGIVGAVLSGINYACMNMMLAVSMSLVIGGNLPNTREARWGGFFGGLMCALLVVMAAILLCLRIPEVTGSDVPMLKTFEPIHPAAASVMVVIIFLMIFNTAIGMFMIALFVVWSLRRRVQIVRETGRRDRIRALLTLREDPRRIYTQNHEKHLERCAEESVADDEAITGVIDVEVLKRHQRERDEQRGEDASSSSTPSS